MFKYILIGLKKDLFGCFGIEEIRDINNETGLKEEGGIEMSIYSASIRPSLKILTTNPRLDRLIVYLQNSKIQK